MSCASSSEKSDMELSDEESPAPSSCSFRASSVAYFWMYSVGWPGKREEREKEETDKDRQMLTGREHRKEKEKGEWVGGGEKGQQG